MFRLISYGYGFDVVSITFNYRGCLQLLTKLFEKIAIIVAKQTNQVIKRAVCTDSVAAVRGTPVSVQVDFL